MNVSSTHLVSRVKRGKGSPLVAAFTLVEILVSLAVLTILLLVSAAVIGQVQNTWAQSNARVSQFREARTAFDIITRNLSQATLNTYIDYDQNYLSKGASTAVNAAAVSPDKYVRRSDLQFICGPAAELVGGGGLGGVVSGHAVFFQAPLGVSQQAGLVGLDRLLCGRGYFVQYSSDEFFKPAFIPPGAQRFRYRLMEFSPPAEKNLIYSSVVNGNTNNINAWFAESGADLDEDENPENLSLNRPVADNILALYISPQLETREGQPDSAKTAIASNYKYNSLDTGVAIPGSTEGTKHLLPPLIRVVLVAVDERSAERMIAGDESGTPPGDLATHLNNFQNAVNLDVELEALQVELRKKKLNFRVFSATIQLRGSKWSA
jgi:uncharacterized protein (TIGR02599 family)